MADQHELAPLIGDGLRRRGAESDATAPPEEALKTVKEHRDFPSTGFFGSSSVKIYVGQAKADGTRHGRGKSYYKSNGKLEYDDGWKDGKRHGAGKSYCNVRGTIKYDGGWKDGKKHGTGESKLNDRFLDMYTYNDEWKNGVPCGTHLKSDGSIHMTIGDDGVKRYYRPNGSPIYKVYGAVTTAYYPNGSASTMYTSRSASITRFEKKPGAWNRKISARHVGNPDEPGTAYYADGSVYCGEFVGGVPNGRGTLKHGEITKVGLFVDGRLHVGHAARGLRRAHAADVRVAQPDVAGTHVQQRDKRHQTVVHERPAHLLVKGQPLVVHGGGGDQVADQPRDQRDEQQKREDLEGAEDVALGDHGWFFVDERWRCSVCDPPRAGPGCSFRVGYPF
jgi:hypothetical protein